jgi:hypothetical protein
MKQILLAFVSSCMVFLLVRAALNAHAGMFDPLVGVADYLTVGITILSFTIIFHRLRSGTWTREQVSELSEIDDDSV